MSSSLTATKIKDTYGQLLHVDGGITSTPKLVYDGDGTATALKVSTTDVQVNNSPVLTDADLPSLATAAQGAKADTALQPSAIGSTVQAYDADLTAWSGKTAPSGTVVGTTDTQTLTNKTITGSFTGNLTGNADTVTNGVYTTGDQTIGGTKTFSSNPVYSAGTANGVAYLNGSKVLTTGSALTFDGTNLGVGGSSPSNAGYTNLYLNNTTGSQIFMSVNGSNSRVLYSNSSGLNYYISDASPHAWHINGSEQMRLTSTGLGIGTSSPNVKLQVGGGTATQVIVADGGSGAAEGGAFAIRQGGTYKGAFGTRATVIGSGTDASMVVSSYLDDLYLNTAGAKSIVFNTNATERMRLDSSGNLGLGVTPSAWDSSAKVLDFNVGAIETNYGNSFGMFFNSYYNGAGNYIYKTTQAASMYIQGNGAHAWFTAPSGTAGNAISFTQAMTLDASGNLGIGSTAPSAVGSYRVVELNGTSGSYLSLRTNGTETGKIYSDGTSTSFEALGARLVTFATNGSERMRIDSSGNLLVGTTSGLTGWKVTIGGTESHLALDSNSRYAQLRFYNQGTLKTQLYDDNTGATFNIARGTGGVYLANNGTSWTSASDERLKENLVDIADGLNKVSLLRSVIGNYIADETKQRKPFLIAQDVQAVLPEAVTSSVQSKDDDTEYLGISYTEVIPLLVAAIKELKAELDATKAEVAALKGA